MILFIVLVYGRGIELLPAVSALPYLGFLLLVYGLLTSRWMDWITATPTALLLALTALMVVSAMLGDWPGGSAALLMGAWTRSLLCYVIVVSLGRGLAGVGSIMSGFAWSVVAIVLTGTTQSVMSGERLGVGPATLAGANDLAQALVIGLPFCAWYVLGSGRMLVSRVVMAGMSGAALIMLLRTGSRGGLLTLVCVLVVLLLVSRGKLRLALVLVTLGIGVAAAFFLPKVIVLRYQTMVGKNVEDTEANFDAQTASGSAEARWALLLASLQVTAQHPLLGVGPGNFVGENATLAKQAGMAANWQVTHNSYTEMSSECGIPAACIFVGLIIYCLRTANRLRKAMALNPELRFQAPMAFWLLIALTADAVSGVFLSGAYLYQLPLLAAAVTSLDRATAGTLSEPPDSPAPSRGTA